MAAMATVSMFLSLRDSTLSVNSDGGWGALQPREVAEPCVFDYADGGHRGN